MRNSIVLSGKRDPDLVALYRQIGSSAFSKLMKDALRSILREGYRTEHIPPAGLVLISDEKAEEAVKVGLVLVSEKDADVRELLSHVKRGQLGYFVKHAIRFYLGPAVTLSGFMDREFTGALMANPVPVQVFSIGGIATKSPTRVKRQQPKRKGPRKKEPEAQPISITPNPPIAPVASSVPYDFTEDTKPKEQPAVFENEEDEMLSLLEGLL